MCRADFRRSQAACFPLKERTAQLCLLLGRRRLLARLLRLKRFGNRRSGQLGRKIKQRVRRIRLELRPLQRLPLHKLSN